MISEEQRAQYWEKGWAVVENVFEPNEAEQIAQLALEYCEQEAGESSKLLDTGSGEASPRKLESPSLKDERFRKFATDERLAKLVGEFLDGEPLLVRDQIFMKPPRFGSAKPYHQDNAYFQCEPGDKVLTAWIALDDVDEENGCLRYIDGSHLGPILPHEPVPGEPHNMQPPEELIDFEKESLTPVKKGGVVFHHSQTLHTSHRNKSDRWRRAHATHWATPEVTAESNVIETAHYKKFNSKT